MKLNRYIFILLAVCAAISAQAQGLVKVNVNVVDRGGNPLVGVAVMSEDQTRVAVTDAAGNATIEVAQGESLTTSFIGYDAQTVSAAPNVEIVLSEDLQTIDAVTVVGVGYGTMRRQDLTGSIASVRADELKEGVITSAEQVLQGKVAGLIVSSPTGDPTQGSNIRLRGGTSLEAGNSPLIVVDGIPGADMNTIQPSEITSIDVLKDASATAIYGSRGANGVIIVTTRRGTAGRTMSYQGFVGVSAVANSIDMLSADQWRQYVRENNLTGAAMDYGADTDWQKEVQRTAITHQHNFAFGSGNEKSGFRASLSYMDAQGVIQETGLRRVAASLTAYQYGLKDRLKFEAGINTNRDDFNGGDIGIWERIYNQNPTVPVMQNGEYTQIGGTNTNNPVEVMKNRVSDQSRIRLLGYVKAEADIIEGLKATVNTSYEFNSYQNRYYQPSYAFYGRTDHGYGSRDLGEYANKQIETYLTYNRTFNEIHKLNVMAGHSWLQNTNEGFGARRRGFDSDAFEYNNLGSGTNFQAGDVNSYKNASKLISLFGRVNYVLNDKYMFTGTIRRDGSSRFGTNYRWGTFLSASAAWRISEEEFMEGARGWLDNLKLRVGYGETGNQEIGNYLWMPLMGTIDGSSYYDPSSGSWKQSYGVTQNANPDLKWESTAQLNVGVDFAFLDRFSVVLEFYSKKTSDLLYSYSVPQPPYAFGTMMANVGDLTNNGFELTVNANIMDRKDFTWDASLTAAYNAQKVVKLSNDQFQTDVVQFGNLHGLQGMTGVMTQVLQEGHPVGTFYGPKYMGIDEEGKFILSEENHFLGDAQPKLTLGLGMNFKYKEFDFGFAGYGLFGQKILNAQGMVINDMARLPAQNVPDKWLSKGITSPPTFSSYWIEKGDFFRMQTVTLGYTMPMKEANWFTNVRFYATVENLFVLTGYTGIDPEVNYSGLLSPGIDKSIGDSSDGDNYYYPRPRTISLGVNLSF